MQEMPCGAESDTDNMQEDLLDRHPLAFTHVGHH